MLSFFFNSSFILDDDDFSTNGKLKKILNVFDEKKIND